MRWLFDCGRRAISGTSTRGGASGDYPAHVPRHSIARLALRIDQNGGARWRRHLRAMLVSIEDVRDIPVVRPRRRRRVFAALDILTVDELVRAATDVCARNRTTHDANARRNVL